MATQSHRAAQAHLIVRHRTEPRIARALRQGKTTAAEAQALLAYLHTGQVPEHTHTATAPRPAH